MHAFRALQNSIRGASFSTVSKSTSSAQTPSRIQQSVLQRNLKSLLRKVHPDLFQHHPLEQAKNSASLQALLPIVQALSESTLSKKTRVGANLGYESISNESEEARRIKEDLIHDHGKPIRVEFFRMGGLNQSRQSPSTESSSGSSLQLVDHTLPTPALISSLIESESPVSLQQLRRSMVAKEMKQNVTSWEWTRSFLELCGKLGVEVQEKDQTQVDTYLDQSVKDLSDLEETRLGSEAGSAAGLKPRKIKQQKEDFGKEFQLHLQSGERGYFNEVTREDATRLIKSNPLLFSGEGLTDNQANRFIRKCIKWHDEDARKKDDGNAYRPHTIGELHRAKFGTSPSAPTPSTPIFDMSTWWGRVPVMITKTADDRRALLKAQKQAEKRQEKQDQALNDIDKSDVSNTGRKSGVPPSMLVLTPSLGKEAMIFYLGQHLERTHSNYRQFLAQQQEEEQKQ